MQVNLHWHVEFCGQYADLAQRRIRNGVGRVRPETNADQWLMSILFMDSQCFLNVFIRVLAVGAGEVDNRCEADTTHARLNGSIQYAIGVEVHICKRGGAGAQHFGNGQSRALIDKITINPAAFGRPDVIL